MERRGSITIFLTLVLSLILSLVCTSIESVRMAAARTQILGSVDVGLYSLFGQYDQALLKEYDLFLLDGSCGGGSLNMAEVYNNMESYIKPLLKQNSQKLSIVQGGFSGYELVTDDSGAAFYHQIVQYMRDTLGSQGVQLLMNKIKNREEKTKEAEKNGKLAEEGQALENYEAEMNSAAENSQAALEEASKTNQNGNAFSSGSENGGSTPEFSSNADQNVTNPITVIKRIRRMGILQLVLPPGASVSEKEISKKTLVSGRTLQQGLPVAGNSKKDSGYTAQILFQQYLLDKLGNFRRPGGKGNGLNYQIEYLLEGKDNDLDNLKGVAGKLLLIREGVNFAHLLSDPAKRGQAAALALTIASTFLVPPIASVIEKALLLCWAFGESILDVRELLDGGRIPLVKSSAEWQLSLGNLGSLLDSLDTRRRSTSDGMSYEDYLQTLLVTKSKNVKLERGMDMMELRIRALPQRENFQLDSCITAIEASIDIEANKRKVFTVTKQYCYD